MDDLGRRLAAGRLGRLPELRTQVQIGRGCSEKAASPSGRPPAQATDTASRLSVAACAGHRHPGDTRVRHAGPGAILSAMSTESDRIPAKPTLDGLEDKWTQRWAKERVVQV